MLFIFRVVTFACVKGRDFFGVCFVVLLSFVCVLLLLFIIDIAYFIHPSRVRFLSILLTSLVSTRFLLLQYKEVKKKGNKQIINKLSFV